MKLFARLMMLLLVAAIAGLFFLKTPNGKPILSATGITHTARQGLQSLQRRWSDTTTAIKRNLGDDNAGKTPVYKWQDDSGQWHYSDELPGEFPDQADAELMHIDPNVDRMDAVPVDTSSDRNTRPEHATPSTEIPLLQALPTPGRIDKAMQKTREAKQQLEERNESMQKKLDDDR